MTKKFILSWIYSSVTMFFLSYIWHGVILSDFYARLDIKKKTFVLIAILTYLALGFIMSKIILRSRLFDKRYNRRPILKGIIIGVLCGLVFFILSNVFGVSFGTASVMKNLIFDLSWQMIEQAAGGLVIGLCCFFIFEESEFVDD